MTPLPLLASFRQDVEAHIPPEGRGGSRWVASRRVLAVILGSSGFHLTILYRLAYTLRARLGFPGRVMASFLSWSMRVGFVCSIAPTARLGGGLILPHPVGLVIGPGAEVGPRAWIFQHVTIGGSPGREGMPRVGPDARIYPGAVLAGPIEVGANVVIGANAVVTVNVPDQTLVRSPSSVFSPIADHFRVET